MRLLQQGRLGTFVQARDDDVAALHEPQRASAGTAQLGVPAMITLRLARGPTPSSNLL